MPAFPVGPRFGPMVGQRGSTSPAQILAEIVGGHQNATGGEIHDRPALGGSSGGGGADTGNYQVPMYLSLLEQIMGGGGGSKKSSSRSSSDPYSVAIRELQRQQGQIGAQTDQNIADIGSWFGQLGGEYKRTGKQNRKANKAAVRDARQFNAGLLAGIADPNVARSIHSGAANAGQYLISSGRNEANFDRRSAADAQRQGAYQKLVQQRLGAQAMADLAPKIAEARGARSQARAEAQSAAQKDQMSTLFSFLGLLPEDQRLQMLGIPGTPDQGDQPSLQDLLGGVTAFGQDPDTKAPTNVFGNFNDLLSATSNAAGAGGLNLSDPAVRDQYRKWIAAYILPQWNQIAQGAGGTRPMTLQGRSFVPTGY